MGKPYDYHVRKRLDDTKLATPNCRAIRALDMISLFPFLGALHNIVDAETAPANYHTVPKAQQDPKYNKDRESIFSDVSPIWKDMPKIDESTGASWRYLLHEIKLKEP